MAIRALRVDMLVSQLEFALLVVIEAGRFPLGLGMTFRTCFSKLPLVHIVVTRQTLVFFERWKQVPVFQTFRWRTESLVSGRMAFGAFQF